MKNLNAAAGRRWLIWIPLLVGAAWVALFQEGGSDRAVVVRANTRPAVSALPKHNTRTQVDVAAANEHDEAAALVIPRGQLIAPARPGEARDLFAARSWSPPAPPPSPPAPEPAPAFPFSFLGKKYDGQSWEVYLSRADQVSVVRGGSVLDGVFRIDKVEPPALSVTHLPTGQSQTLAIGDAP